MHVTGGNPCRLPPVVTEPLPLCEEHFESSGLRQYQEWCEAAPEDIAIDVHVLRSKAYERALADPDFEPEDLLQRIAWRQARKRRAFERVSDQSRQKARLREAQAEIDGTIYFVGIEKLIKIGKTLNLNQRLASFSYPNLKVLATERGYTLRETQLHNRFRELRSHGEWFRAEPPLLDYIAALPKTRR